MISESSKETVPEFYLTSFLPINAIRDLYFFKNCVYVLLSIKQIKNVKNISFVILFTEIVHQILGGIFILTAVTATMSTCCNTVQYIFLHEQFVEQGLFEESLHLQRTNLSKSAGAAGCFVYTGFYNPLRMTQLHSKGSTWASSRNFQSITCRCIR